MDNTGKRILIQLSLIIFIIIMLILLFFIGIRIGYSTIGKGQASDAFKAETWQHILDFMK